ncbi:hypothetical protein [uncultured Corynebacterium sp.]|uniref:hypothetical protein n=1 Tax=uncultured Corynebacterium sp. TaxID=159447 RepID=UPI002624AB06|nr:hypothetical protein [uncultured Corynebacterium sp.]
MSCGACGGSYRPAQYKVTFDDGSERIYLSETEARIAATNAGGGHITRVENT